MGTYIYSLKKKTVKAKVLPSGEEVTIALASYSCKEGCAAKSEKAKMTRAQKLVEDGFAPDFYTTSFDGIVYKFTGEASFPDTPDLGTPGGYILKFKNKYFILPIEERYMIKFKHYLPELWNHVFDEDMHVRMNEHYVATVRCMASLEDYMFKADNDVDVNELMFVTNNSAPEWMVKAAHQLILKKKIQDWDKLEFKFNYASWLKDLPVNILT